MPFSIKRKRGFFMGKRLVPGLGPGELEPEHYLCQKTGSCSNRALSEEPLEGAPNDQLWNNLSIKTSNSNTTC